MTLARNSGDAAMTDDTRRLLGVFEWPARVSSAQKRGLGAGGLGWLLDAMDVTLYALVLAHLMRALGMDKPTAGFLGSLPWGLRRSAARSSASWPTAWAARAR